MSERSLTRRAALGALAAGCFAPRKAASAAPRKGRPGLRHYYWVNGASPATLLSGRAAAIDLVSPQWFHVQASGRLRTEIDPELLAAAGELRIPLMPVVLNEGHRPEVAQDVLATEKGWKALAEHLGVSALEYGFRGLQVDFEGFPEAARARYARFVAQLARSLRARGLECSVAVGAPLAPAPDAEGRWLDGPHAAGLDYAALGQEVDTMTLMTYDQHTDPDSPGPVAGWPWVEACARKVLDFVPASKLLLGIPLYYRRWSGGHTSEGSHAEALALASRAGVPVSLDSREREKTYRFLDRGVPNVVWLQDRETVGERVALARELGLAGFSAWRLGHEDRALWNALRPRAGSASHGTKATLPS